MAKKAKSMRAYRLTEKTIREIERLSAEWECTHADVIERAVEHTSRAYVEHDGFGGETGGVRPFTPLLRPSEKKK